MRTIRPNHVLLVEPDPNEVEIYSELIREAGDCTLDVVTRIDQTFDWVSRGNYHLVVIDKPDGVSLLEQVKRVSPSTSVILISDRATVEQAVTAIRMGAEDYFKKPFDMESFKLAIKRGLDRKTVFGEDSDAADFFNLLNSCQMISASLEEAKVCRIVRSYLMRELSSEHSAIYQLNGADPERIDLGLDDNRSDEAMLEIMDIAVHSASPITKMAESSDSFFRFVDRSKLTPGMFVFRFKGAGKSDFYCICLSPRRPGDIKAFEDRLRMLRTQIEVTTKNIHQYKGVEDLVYLDDVTGLYNTRYLSTILDREIAHSTGTGKPFAVLFVDIDKFKSVNDTHGHLIGSKLLIELGAHVKRQMREHDTVFRYGGDEFVVVLSACDLETAKSIAERIRESVQATSFLAPESKDIRFTVSIGVAMYPQHARSKKAIIDAADRAMYVAKKESRNRVYVLSPADLVPVPASAKKK